MLISNERREELLEFQNRFNLNFSDLDLLNRAFVHSSYTSENSLDVLLCYERLEFFGDAVLKLSVSDFLYNHFENCQEGDLTKYRAYIVSDENICNWAKALGMGELLILGRNEQKQGGRFKDSILACSFEALLGAIFIEYKEKGYEKAKEFLKDNFIDEIYSISQRIQYINPKATLQEYTQGISKKLPLYVVEKEEGKAHNKTFFVNVLFEGKIIGKGSAKSIKKAEQEAAGDALLSLNIIRKNV